ncbi:MAG TPA: hypothetical protein VMZ31_15520 [Phycisphaerae bacterium]|nr:hypothetical protein [Phycisphaerae bacterium]
MDQTGNIYVTGPFSGRVNFDPDGSDEHESHGGTDVFVTKLGPDGSYGWTRTFGGAADDLADALAVDSVGNVYVAGTFRGTDVDFDPTAGTDLRSSHGNTDAFLLRLNSDGSYGWAATVGGPEADYARAVAVHPDNFVVVAGYFRGGNVDLDPTAGSDLRSSAGAFDVFITRLALNGQYGWSRTVGGEDTDTAFGVAVDAWQRIVVAGWFASTSLDLDPTLTEDWHTCVGQTDVYALKLESDGSYVWGRTFGGSQFDHVYVVASDHLGDVYLGGTFQGQDVDFDPGAGQDLHSSAGWYDGFVSKLTSDGEFRFCRTFGGTSYDVVRALAFDSYGGLLVTGGFEEANVGFDPGLGGDFHSSNGLSDVFLMRLGLDGSYRWTRTLGGSQPDVGYGADLLPNGAPVLVGYFGGADVDFDPSDGTDLHSSAGLSDAFTSVWAGWVPGDFDCDGDVDLADHASLAQAFAGSGVPAGDPQADLDGDGDGDLADFCMFATHMTGPQ